VTVQGIDISFWQGPDFDWAAWRDKISFGMAKATEGATLTDPYFAANWKAMWNLQLDHRLCRFAYAYFRAGQDPEAQAEHLVATVRAEGLLPGDNFVLDLEETVPESGENDGIRAAQCAPRAVAFLRKVNELAPGHRILAYLNPSWAQAGGSAGMGAWHLWVADYGTPAPQVPAPWDQWTFWQDGDDPVDQDVFNGDLDHLLAFCRMPDQR
jgi:lysozyme